MSRPTNERFCYKGVEYTMSELVNISNLHRETILSRLKRGMTLDAALSLPRGRQLPSLSAADIGRQVRVVFPQPLPSVYRQWQPTLGKEYTATIHGQKSKSNRLYGIFYIVTLENGKPLITYPGEFQILEEEPK